MAYPGILGFLKIFLQEIWTVGFWPLLIMLIMASCQNTEQRGRAQGPVKSGKAHGTWTEDHFNGIKASQGRYGATEIVEFHFNGNPPARGNWNHSGDMGGSWIEYDLQGQVVSEAFYRDGLRLAGGRSY